MKTDELRTKFIEFFKSKGHTVCPSDSLVPENDPSLLFTGAGMNQFKHYFLGKIKPPYKRATSCQKCLRTGDIEKVGRTSSHHTFFEMLGNFSFGDYFKQEAITWAWEFLTKELKLAPERLSVSVYEDDDEAYQIWHKTIGLSPDKIFKLGAKDNFWPANAPLEGPNGPCGPCSEIFYDQGADYGCGSPTCDLTCDCQRFVEIWNLVFTQFDRQEDGELLPLPQKNIDTGMGLERLTSVMQNVQTNFDIDIFKSIIKAIADTIKVIYQPHKEEGARIRRIADHVRAITFMISDGVFPSNEGRGYVERRILRRAIRDAITMGVDKPFLYKIVPTVIDVMKHQYPELVDKRESIARLVKAEEEKFLETVDQGMLLLEQTIANLGKTKQKIFPGTEAFKLYDTYGFPVDLTESILAEKGYKLDMMSYQQSMNEQKTRARGMSKIAAQIFANNPLDEVKNILTETKFIGYEKTTAQVKIEAILLDNKTLVIEAPAKSKVTVITEQSPFYAEAGGQVGDTGCLKGDGVEVKIFDTQKLDTYILHIGEVKKGTLKTGLKLEAQVDLERRQAIARNHTSTHLLQHTLRKILGEHVEQSGSLVTPDHLRFDFSHFSAIKPEELLLIEESVNKLIMGNSPVVTRIMSINEARKTKALAFFAEEYGQEVRLVEVGDYSKELCAGTHVKATGEIGYFKLINESSVASGVRRIEAATGTAAIKTALADKETLQQAAELVGTIPAQLIDKVKTMLNDFKSARDTVANYEQKTNLEIARALLDKGTLIAGVRVITEVVSNRKVEDLRVIADQLRKAQEPVIALLGIKNDSLAVPLQRDTANYSGQTLAPTGQGGVSRSAPTAHYKKVNLILTIAPSLIKDDFDAIALIKEPARIIGGSGGGRKELAQAGGKDADKLDEAFQYFTDAVSKRLTP